MGRGKLTLKRIENEKCRMTTYQKRKRGLKKKAEEFATLCGVPTCMILFGPRLKNRLPEVEVWPRDVNSFMDVVNLYRDKAFSSRGIKAYNLYDFFNERKRKVDDKIKKLRKANLESMFPGCWDDRLNGLSVDQLRFLLVTLDHNIEVARRKIVVVKGEQEYCPKSDIFGGNSFGSPFSLSPPSSHSHQVMIQKNFELADYINNKQQPLDHHAQLFYPSDRRHHHHRHHHPEPLNLLSYHDVNPNEEQVVANGGRGDHLHQFGHGHGHVLQPAWYLDPTALIVDNNNQRAMYFYSPSMQASSQPYEHDYPPPLPPSPPLSLPSNVPPYQMHHHGSLQFNDFFRDMDDFGIKTHRGKF